MDEWVGSEDLAHFVSDRTIRRKIGAGDWVWRRAASNGKRGQPQKEVLVTSLPTHLQATLAARQVASVSPLQEPSQVNDAIEESEDQSNKKLVALANALLRFPAAQRERWSIHIGRLAEIVEQYDGIRPKRRKSKTGGWEPVNEVKTLCKQAVCTDQMILDREPSRGRPVSPRTLDRWNAQYKQHGLVVFLRSSGTAQSKSEDKRKAKFDRPEAEEWARKVWRNYRSPRAWYEAVIKKARAENWGKVPSETWFYRRWKRIPDPVMDLHIGGKKAFTDKWSMYVPRTYEDLDALQILCGDHSQRDVSVVLPSGDLIRPWLTLWQDLRTGLLWGWHLDLIPSSYTIGRAYHNGVITWGAQPFSRPDEGYVSFVYTDQGKDYKSRNIDGQITVHKAAAKVGGGFEMIRVTRQIGLLNELGVQRIMARGYNAREKVVERTHAVISFWEENTFEGYCGRGTESKPERWREMYRQHQRFEKGKRSESPFITLEEYRLQLGEWIAEYNRKEHERATLGGKRVVPVEEYNRLYTTRFEIDEDSLGLLTLKSESRVIKKLGVRVTGTPANHYFYHPGMFEFKGKEVEVLSNEADYSAVKVILPSVPPQLVMAMPQTPVSVLTPDKGVMKEIMAQQAHERKLAKEWAPWNERVRKGITAEDVVAAAHAEYELEENEAVAVNESPKGRVQKITRMDRLAKARTNIAKPISLEAVRAAKADETIFEDRPEAVQLENEWGSLTEGESLFAE